MVKHSTEEIKLDKRKYDDLIARTMSEFEEGGWDAVLGYINDCIQKTPDFIEAYHVRGELYLEKGDFQEALKDLEKVITIDPNEATSYFYRGLVYARSGDDDKKCLDAFTKAIELNADYAEAYANRGNVYLKMGEFKKAVNDCTKAIELLPDSMEPHFNRGLAYMNLEEPEKALADYHKVIALTPENAEAYAKRGFLYSLLGNEQAAVGDYEKFLELDPGNDNAKLVQEELERIKSGKTAESYKAPVNMERRLLLIFSAIGFVLGTIIGIVNGKVLLGMWFGLGGGVALSFLPEIPGIFRVTYRQEGFGEALKTTFLGGAIWFVIFMLAGPIGFIIRLIRTR